MISKCLYNIFLAVKKVHRAGFGENNGVIYAKYYKSILIIEITVLYTV